jgi:acetyltransferase EpsM
MIQNHEIVIIGAGRHATVVIAAAQSAGWTIHCILDDDTTKWNSTLLGCCVAGPVSELSAALAGHRYAFLAVGDNRTRQYLQMRCEVIRWARIVHRGAIVDARASISPGTLICAGAIVNPFAQIGMHAIINTAAVIEHDVSVGDYSHIAPSATLTGAVKVGEGAFIGAGSVVLPSRIIGAWSCIGAGAVVTRNVPPDVTSFGVPSRIACDP